jgi:ligand-binding SRPBCC domain-containing protein
MLVRASARGLLRAGLRTFRLIWTPTRQTSERVVRGSRRGHLQLGDVVTWEARHLGIAAADRADFRATPPHHFRDELVRGAFRTLCHDHYFEAVAEGTLVRDVFEFSSPGGWFGRCIERLFLTRYLTNFLASATLSLKRQLEADAAA